MQFTPEMEFGRYRLLAELGAGGMGEVFLAEDTQLGRKIALKLLPAKFADDHERLDRFVREARAASALNHPNIITVYEIGECEGINFIAIEYIDGQTLRDRMASQKITFDEVLAVFIQTAEALSAAHQAGITHRDIKPENIMIRPDGYVKVLDFGLAKLSEKDGAASDPEQETRQLMQTEPGMVMGTSAYMSPEQARGKEIDARSDVFSFGAVMYEVLAGYAPFKGETTIDVLAEVINSEPQPLASVASHLPRELQRIVHKCLKKKRGQRYQVTTDLLNDLKEFREELRLEARLDRSAVPAALQIKRADASAGRTTTGSSRDAILLTEFDNKTGDPIFDQTLKAALAFSLGQSPFLDIFPDSKVNLALSLMGRERNSTITREVGQEICVRRGLKAYIAGTIAAFGSMYVLTLEAVNAQTQESIALEFEQVASREEVLAAIGRAATGIREKLGESLSSIEQFDMPDHITTPSLEALQYYVHGQNAALVGGVSESIPFYEKAIEIDSNFASAHLMLGYNFANSERWKRAAAAVTRAYEVRDAASENEKYRITYAYHKLVTGEIDKAIETLEMWGKTFSHNVAAATSLADCYMRTGQFEKAVAVLRARSGLERADVAVAYANLAESLLPLGRYDEVRETCQAAFDKGFDGFYFHILLVQIGFIEGDLPAMKKSLSWFKGRTEEYIGFDLQTGAAAFQGQWRKTKELSKQAIDLAIRGDAAEVAAQYSAEQALRIVFWNSANGLPTVGNAQLASVLRTQSSYALRLERGRTTLPPIALAFAAAGLADETKTLIDEMRREFPKDTLINELWLPTIRASLALQSGKTREAIDELEAARRFEPAGKFYPQYLRGLGYLNLNSPQDAVREFDKILARRGEAPLSSIFALAQLGKARATIEKAEYEKFFDLWKTADRDMPALVAARKEYNLIR